MEKLLFVVGEEGDWEGMYLEGVLIVEGHIISKYDALDALKEYKGDLDGSYGEYTINQEHLEENGLPKHFKDIDKTMISKNT